MLLDFTGGSLSILQMFLISYNYSEYIQYSAVTVALPYDAYKNKNV